MKINRNKFLSLGLCVGLLVLWRYVHQHGLYDPLETYYSGSIRPSEYPKVQPILLLCSWGLLYYLNSMTSLAVLYLWYKDGASIRFIGLCYVVLGLLLLVGTIFTVQFFGPQLPNLVFQLRRFLVYPILLLLFFPALWYQKQLQSKQP